MHMMTCHVLMLCLNTRGVTEAAEDTHKVPLSELMLEKCMHVGSNLAKNEKGSLIAFLHENQDVFTWSAKDLQGVSHDLA